MNETIHFGRDYHKLKQENEYGKAGYNLRLNKRKKMTVPSNNEFSHVEQSMEQNAEETGPKDINSLSTEDFMNMLKGKGQLSLSSLAENLKKEEAIIDAKPLKNLAENLFNKESSATADIGSIFQIANNFIQNKDILNTLQNITGKVEKSEAGSMPDDTTMLQMHNEMMMEMRRITSQLSSLKQEVASLHETQKKMTEIILNSINK